MLTERELDLMRLDSQLNIRQLVEEWRRMFFANRTPPQPQTIALSGPNSILEIGEPLYEEKPAITASDTIALQGGTLSTPLGTSTYA